MAGRPSVMLSSQRPVEQRRMRIQDESAYPADGVAPHFSEIHVVVPDKSGRGWV